jgi:DNA-directed RNA polymerase specialized sigma24 family protein
MEWSEDRVRPVIDRVVARWLPVFSAFPDIERDDLVQEGLKRSREAHDTFNPAKGAKYETWIFRCVYFRLNDVWRTRGRRQDRMKTAMEDYCDRQRMLQNDKGDEDYSPESLADWLYNVYLAAKQVFPAGRQRRGRKWFSPAQCVAVTLFMQKMNLTTRGAREVFVQSAALRAAVRFRHVPHWTWFSKAQKFATENFKVSAGGLVVANE